MRVMVDFARAAARRRGRAASVPPLGLGAGVRELRWKLPVRPGRRDRLHLRGSGDARHARPEWGSSPAPCPASIRTGAKSVRIRCCRWCAPTLSEGPRPPAPSARPSRWRRAGAKRRPRCGGLVGLEADVDQRVGAIFLGFARQLRNTAPALGFAVASPAHRHGPTALIRPMTLVAPAAFERAGETDLHR